MQDTHVFGSIFAFVTADGARHLEELHPEAARQKKKAILSGKHPEVISFKIFDSAKFGKRCDWKSRAVPEAPAEVPEAPRKSKKAE
jgi:hypothetical protein